MTSVKIFYDQTQICGFEVSGHSTVSVDDQNGKIVCSAVSSAAYMAANTIIEIIKDNPLVSVSDAEMVLKVKNPSDKTVAVLRGFKLHIEQLAEQYSNNIKVYSEV